MTLLGRYWSALGLVSVLGCSTQVGIPAPGSDHPPVINVNNFVVGGSGDVSDENVTETRTVTVTPNTQLQIHASATNPGGVKSLRLDISKGGFPLYAVQSLSVPDAQGKVPDSLSIFGSDGFGNAGGKVALTFVTGTDIAQTRSTATNYNGQMTIVDVTYVAADAAALPQIAKLAVNPSVGPSTTVSWEVENCAVNCDVTLEVRDYISDAALGLHTSLPTHGQVLVHLTVPNTRFVLIAKNATGPATKQAAAIKSN